MSAERRANVRGNLFDESSGSELEPSYPLSSTHFAISIYRHLYVWIDTGSIGQNVYLFRASDGLATVFRRAVDYQ